MVNCWLSTLDRLMCYMNFNNNSSSNNFLVRPAHQTGHTSSANLRRVQVERTERAADRLLELESLLAPLLPTAAGLGTHWSRLVKLDNQQRQQDDRRPADYDLHLPADQLQIHANNINYGCQMIISSILLIAVINFFNRALIAFNIHCIGTLCCELCKNGWTNWNAVRDAGSRWSRKRISLV